MITNNSRRDNDSLELVPSENLGIGEAYTLCFTYFANTVAMQCNAMPAIALYKPMGPHPKGVNCKHTSIIQSKW